MIKRFVYSEIEYSKYPSPIELGEEGFKGNELACILKVKKRFFDNVLENITNKKSIKRHLNEKYNMEKKINIAELLKDCPKGMELYSPIFGKVYLDKIRPHLAIVVTDKEQGDFREEFLYDGRYGMNGECMLFPSKENRNWSKFQRPFKNGDIIYNPNIKAISILFTNDSEKSISHVFLNVMGDFGICHYHDSDLSDWRFATEEEKQKLFNAIKENGYKWNAETKTLERLCEPRFKVGDRIKTIYKPYKYIIKGITNTHYTLEEVENKFQYMEPIIEDKNWKLVPKFKIGDKIRKKGEYSTYTITDVKYEHYCCGEYVICNIHEDDWELVPDKFDITTLKPFYQVLVRNNDYQMWTIDFFSFYNETNIYPFACVGHYVNQCIPYEGNEHLLGTSDDCNDFYKTWK